MIDSFYLNEYTVEHYEIARVFKNYNLLGSKVTIYSSYITVKSRRPNELSWKSKYIPFWYRNVPVRYVIDYS